MMKFLFLTGAAFALVACNRVPEIDNEQALAVGQSAAALDPAGVFETLPELVPPAPMFELKDPVPGQDGPPVRKSDLVRSTEENVNSASWSQQLLEKQHRQAQLLAAEAKLPSPAPTAAPGIVEKQQRFLQMIQDRQAELDALDPESRERLYDELKWKELGE